MKNIIKNILLTLFVITLLPFNANANSNVFSMDYLDNYYYEFKCVHKNSNYNQDITMQLIATPEYLRVLPDDLTDINYIQINRNTFKVTHDLNNKNIANDKYVEIKKIINQFSKNIIDGQKSRAFIDDKKYQLGKIILREINFSGFSGEIKYTPIEFVKVNKTNNFSNYTSIFAIKVDAKMYIRKDDIIIDGKGSSLIHMGSGATIQSNMKAKVKSTQNSSHTVEYFETVKCNLINEDSFHPNFNSIAKSLNIQIKEKSYEKRYAEVTEPNISSAELDAANKRTN